LVAVFFCLVQLIITVPFDGRVGRIIHKIKNCPMYDEAQIRQLKEIVHLFRIVFAIRIGVSVLPWTGPQLVDNLIRQELSQLRGLREIPGGTQKELWLSEEVRAVCPDSIDEHVLHLLEPVNIGKLIRVELNVEVTIEVKFSELSAVEPIEGNIHGTALILG
jgi:hypothetical protein